MVDYCIEQNTNASHKTGRIEVQSEKKVIKKYSNRVMKLYEADLGTLRNNYHV